MSIFAIFLLIIIFLLNLKINVSIYFKFDNFDTFIEGRFGAIKFKRKGTLVKRKKKYIIEKKFTKFIKKKNIKIDDLLSFFKYVEISKLNIDFVVGTPFLFLTVFAVPFFSTAFELVKAIPFKRLKNYSYVVVPDYNDFKLFSEIETEFKIKVFDLIKMGVSILTVKLCDYFFVKFSIDKC